MAFDLHGLDERTNIVWKLGTDSPNRGPVCCKLCGDGLFMLVGCHAVVESQAVAILGVD